MVKIKSQNHNVQTKIKTVRVIKYLLGKLRNRMGLMQIVARIRKIVIILLLDLLLGINEQEKENNLENLLLRNVPIRELILKGRILGIWSRQLEWERFQVSKRFMILRVLRTLWDDWKWVIFLVNCTNTNFFHVIYPHLQ